MGSYVPDACCQTKARVQCIDKRVSFAHIDPGSWSALYDKTEHKLRRHYKLCSLTQIVLAASLGVHLRIIIVPVWEEDSTPEQSMGFATSQGLHAFQNVFIDLASTERLNQTVIVDSQLFAIDNCSLDIPRVDYCSAGKTIQDMRRVHSCITAYKWSILPLVPCILPICSAFCSEATAVPCSEAIVVFCKGLTATNNRRGCYFRMGKATFIHPTMVHVDRCMVRTHGKWESWETYVTMSWTVWSLDMVVEVEGKGGRSWVWSGFFFSLYPRQYHV